MSNYIAVVQYLLLLHMEITIYLVKSQRSFNQLKHRKINFMEPSADCDS